MLSFFTTKSHKGFWFVIERIEIVIEFTEILNLLKLLLSLPKYTKAHKG